MVEARYGIGALLPFHPIENCSICCADMSDDDISGIERSGA
jgi:hypothetical protein